MQWRPRTWDGACLFGGAVYMLDDNVFPIDPIEKICDESR